MMTLRIFKRRVDTVVAVWRNSEELRVGMAVAEELDEREYRRIAYLRPGEGAPSLLRQTG